MLRASFGPRGWQGGRWLEPGETHCIGFSSGSLKLDPKRKWIRGFDYASANCACWRTNQRLNSAVCHWANGILINILRLKVPHLNFNDLVDFRNQNTMLSAQIDV
jgi:hypothetical protein